MYVPISVISTGVWGLHNVANAFSDWKENPIKTTVIDYHHSPENVPFPAVTFKLLIGDQCIYERLEYQLNICVGKQARKSCHLGYGLAR